MTASSIGLLVFFVSVFAIFGGVLGWASWDETRTARRKKQS